MYNDTRGAIIHTRNLNGSTNIANRVELIDNDNNWTTAEHGPNNNDMALDIHWGLQRIYDRLYNTHGKNSYNNNGRQINAYIKYGNTAQLQDNAFWNQTDTVLFFGVGNTIFRPLASIDVVAHEFGHGITQFQIGWGNNEGFLNEGMSDIWGAIMKYRITPNQPTWIIGNQVMNSSSYSCLRNIFNTNDANAYTKTANTFGSTQYNNTSDIYVRGGVFSHWFYRLVNGGSGTNGVNNYYKVYGVGMDIAEQLIVEAVYGGFLRNTTSYAQLRTNFVQAAASVTGMNTAALVQQIENAWYAVGVGIQPTQISISGPSSICSTGSFNVSNAPAGFTWFTSGPLSISGSNTSTSVTVSKTSDGQGSVGIKYGTVIFPTYGVSVGSPVFDEVDGPTSVDPDGTQHTYYAYYSGYGGVPTNYSWSVGGAPSSWYSITSYGGTAFVSFYGEATYYVYVYMSNSCGGAGGQVFVEAYNRRSQSSAYTVYPNPVDDILSIDIQQTLSNANKPLRYDIHLYDLQGNLVRQTTANQAGVVQVNVSGLPDGNYFLHIYDGTGAKPYMKQIVVKH